MTIISSIEGQAEGITLLFMLLIIKLMKNYPLISFSLTRIGLQWKYIPLLCLPYLLIYYWNNKKIIFNGLLVFFTLLAIFSLPPLFFSNYVFRFLFYYGNLPFGQLPSNPMAWTYLYISSIILWIILIYICYYLIKNPNDLVNFLLLLPILLFFKYYRYVFPWYWIWIIPGMLLLPDKPRINLWRFFAILFPIAAFEFIELTAGWGYVLKFIGL